MPDTSIRADGLPTGWTVYAVLTRNSDGYVWNGSTWVTFAVANLSTYAVSMSESPASSGRYACTFPSGADAGNYSWTVSKRVGGSPATSDPMVGGGESYWDGTGFGAAPALLPEIPPPGYGNLSGINGTVQVNQDFGGVGALSAIDPTGRGIGGATVTAYLAADYSADGRNATVQAQVTTTGSGQWQTAMLLQADETYTLLYSNRGYLPNPVNIDTPA